MIGIPNLVIIPQEIAMILLPELAAQQTILPMGEDHRRVPVTSIQQLHVIPVVRQVHIDLTILGECSSVGQGKVFPEGGLNDD